MKATLGSPLATLRRVSVGTKNPPKLEAVRQALLQYAAKVEVQGIEVASGVPEQPVGLAEIARGARNRARAAAAGASCDLAVGIEDGLVEFPELPGTALNVGCAWVTDGERDGYGLSSGFAYPPACVAEALSPPQPIGDLFDRFWRSHRSDEDSGAGASSVSVGNVGKLSLGVLTRSEYARHAVLCALVRFLHPDLYPTALEDVPV